MKMRRIEREKMHAVVPIRSFTAESGEAIIQDGIKYLNQYSYFLAFVLTFSRACHCHSVRTRVTFGARSHFEKHPCDFHFVVLLLVGK